MKESRSNCPINQALEVVGDKWTLLIIRDIMFDHKRHFREMLASDEHIASNILTDRLNKLENFGILVKTKDPNHKQKNIYSLTNKGVDLMPAMIELAHWSVKHREVAEKDKIHVRELVSGGATLQEKMSEVLLKEFAEVSKK